MTLRENIVWLRSFPGLRSCSGARFAAVGTLSVLGALTAATR